MKKKRSKFMKNLRHLCVGCVCVFGLMTIVATGGGGDEEGGAPVNTDLPLPLTSGNAVGVAGLTLEAAEGAVTAASLGTGGLLSADSPDGGNFDVNILRISQDVLDRFLEVAQPTTLPLIGRVVAWPPTNPAVLSCTSGTSVSITYTDVDGDLEVDAGDSAVLNYNNCGEMGLTLNGEVTVGVLELNGDPPSTLPWMVKFRLNFNSLTANDGTSTIGVSGTLDATVDALATGTVVTTITTEVSTGGGGTASRLLHFEEGYDFIQLTLFTLVFEETTPGGAFALSAQGTLESSLIGGTVTFLTTVPITGTDFDNNDPSAGQLRITGAANATILLVATPPNSVELQVDLDGDGNGDVTIPTTWAELQAAADIL